MTEFKAIRDDGSWSFLQHVAEGLHKDELILPIPPYVPQSRVDALVEGILFRPVTEPGLMYMTSGTTGISKLVVRSKESLEDEGYAVGRALNLNSNKTVCSMTPVSHSFGFGMFLASMCVGARFLYCPGPDPFARSYQARMYSASQQIDVLTGVPLLFRLLLRSDDVSYLAKTACYSGGEPLPPKLRDQWAAKTGGFLLQEYGLSETGIVSFSDAVDSPESVGRPLDDVGIQFTEEGEIIVHRENNPRSYYFGEHPDTFVGYTGVRTGDLGHMDVRSLVIDGRLKNVAVVGGKKVALEEVDAKMHEAPGVEEACAVRIEGKDGTDRVVACLSITDEFALKEFWNKMGELESYKVPLKVVYHDGLPRTASGKVDRNALPA